MEPLTATDKSSEVDSACNGPMESDTTGPSSTSTGSEIKSQKEFFVHKLTKYDTLAGLAIRYGLSVYDIKRANGLITDGMMQSRETLIIPLQSAFNDEMKGGEHSQELTRLSSIQERQHLPRYLPSTSQNSSYNPHAGKTTPSLDDQDQRSVSEIELEMMEDERIKRAGQWTSRTSDINNKSSTPPPPPPTRAPPLMSQSSKKSSTTTFSSYLTSMAASFIQTTEQLFGTDSTSTSSLKTESFYDKIRKLASYSTLSESEPADRTISKRMSPDTSPLSRKDMGKLD